MGILDLMGYVQKQGEAGRERGQQSYLGKLAGQAYGAAPDQQRGIVQQAITTNPDAGFSLAGALGKSQDRDFSQLGQAAAIMSSLPEDQKAAFYSAKVAPLAQQAGYPVPGEYDPRFQKAIDTIAQRAGGMGNSSELQTFNAMTQGLNPDEVAKARQIALGLQPRAVTGAMKFDTFQGADGRPRPQRNNPTTGGIEIFYDEAGQWVPLGQAQGQQAPMQAAPQTQFTGPDGLPIKIEQGLPPELQASIASDAARWNGIPDGSSAQLPPQQVASFGGGAPQQASALPPPLDYQNGGQRVPGLGVGRSPEEQAALTTSAQEAAKLTYLPTDLALRTDDALGRARGESQIKQGAETSALQAGKQRDAADTLSLLSEAEKLIPQSTGSRAGNVLDTLAGGVGVATEGGNAIAALQTIAGQLTSKMPRMQGPQSDKDVELYKQMAGDLANPNLPRERRMAALQQIRALNQKYADDGRLNSSTGRAPQAGAVQDGYRFKGGNPADPSSWERI